jgi:hypothetical protein
MVLVKPAKILTPGPQTLLPQGIVGTEHMQNVKFVMLQG